MGDVPLVKGDAFGRGIGRLRHVEQMQAVGDAGVCPGHGDVIEHRVQRKPAERHGVALAGRQQPAFGLDPGVGLFLLFAVRELLAEQAVVVVEPHAVAGQPQRGDGVQEAGGQPPQAAVA